MPNSPCTATTPISILSLTNGVFASVCACEGAALVDSLHSGSPDTGFIAIAFLPTALLGTVLIAILALPMFLILRRKSPQRVTPRLAFILIVLTPSIIFQIWILFLLISGLFDQHSPSMAFRTNLAARFQSSAYQYWPPLTLIGFCGGLACWFTDQLPSLWSDNVGRRHRARWTAASLISLIILPLLGFSLLNQYIVIHKAKEKAGTRPYCLLVPAYGQGLYKKATKKWQLSIWQLRAIYQWTDGSRGGYYATNHGLLVLDEPRQYLNWSYWSENFVTDPLVNILHGVGRDGHPWNVMEFKSCAPERDFAAHLK